MTVTIIHLGADAHLYLPTPLSLYYGDDRMERLAAGKSGPPERVWVPWSDDLPTVVDDAEAASEHMRRTGSTEKFVENMRPLAPGDVVTLTGDCPTCSGTGLDLSLDSIMATFVKRMDGAPAGSVGVRDCPDDNFADGRVSVAPARVAEILPVWPYDEERDWVANALGRNVIERQPEGPTVLFRFGRGPNMEPMWGVPMGTHRIELPGVWSSARWGIRLEVETTT